jgi:hypothetical protein
MPASVAVTAAAAVRQFVMAILRSLPRLGKADHVLGLQQFGDI